MGKYDNKITSGKSDASYENLVLNGLEKIANELAEQNRLTRLKLRIEMKSKVSNNLYQTVKHKGNEMIIPPDEKRKENVKKDLRIYSRPNRGSRMKGNTKTIEAEIKIYFFNNTDENENQYIIEIIH